MKPKKNPAPVKVLEKAPEINSAQATGSGAEKAKSISKAKAAFVRPTARKSTSGPRATKTTSFSTTASAS